MQVSMGDRNREKTVEINTVIRIVEFAGVNAQPLLSYQSKPMIGSDEDFCPRSQVTYDSHDLSINQVFQVLLVDECKGPRWLLPSICMLFHLDFVQFFITELKNIIIQIASPVAHSLPGSGSIWIYPINTDMIAQFSCQGLFEAIIFSPVRSQAKLIWLSACCNGPA